MPLFRFENFLGGAEKSLIGKRSIQEAEKLHEKALFIEKVGDIWEKCLRIFEFFLTENIKICSLKI